MGQDGGPDPRSERRRSANDRCQDPRHRFAPIGLHEDPEFGGSRATLAARGPLSLQRQSANVGRAMATNNNRLPVRAPPEGNKTPAAPRPPGSALLSIAQALLDKSK